MLVRISDRRTEAAANSGAMISDPPVPDPRISTMTDTTTVPTATMPKPLGGTRIASTNNDTYQVP